MNVNVQVYSSGCLTKEGKDRRCVEEAVKRKGKGGKDGDEEVKNMVSE